MRMTGNGQYLVTVLWRQGLTTRLTALPWTVGRTGLVGINLGMALLLWRKSRHAADDVSPANEKAEESLLSTCSSEGQWTHRQVREPATYPGMPQCLDQGRSAGDLRRCAFYDLLPSTESSCTAPVDLDTEEELDDSSQFRTQVCCRVPMGPLPSPLPHPPLPRFSPLTPEARQARVWRWVEESGPDEDDDEGHVTEVAVGGHAQYRQHSGSFSHRQSAVLPDLVPKCRKNSAIF